jgi:hypothetical protein
MAESQLSISNKALSNIGVATRIASVSEQTTEALQCALFFEQAQKGTFEAFPWPFATRYATSLTLVGGTSATPYNDEWQYAYRYPPQEGDPAVDVCARVLQIVRPGAMRRETTPIPFRIGSDETGRLILTDWEDPTIRYTRYIYDFAQYTQLFVETLSWKLANLIAPTLAKDPVKTMDLTEKVFYARLSTAQAVALSEGQFEEDLDAEWVRER